MKKIKLQLLILLMGWLLISPSLKANNLFSNLDPATEKKYWDYLDERLIDSEQRVITRFQNDHIHVFIGNATSEDSLIVNNLLKELQLLIPSKKVQLVNFSINPKDVDILVYFPKRDSLGHYTDHFGYSSNHYKETFIDSVDNKIEYTGFKGQYQPEIYYEVYRLGFRDSISHSKRKEYTEYCILSSLCAFNGTSDSYTVNNENGIYNKKAFDPTRTQFTEADKFLIAKLYSPDFEKQYKRYFIKNYSFAEYYKPYLSAIFSPTTVKIISLLIVFILLIVFYKPVFLRKYRYNYFSYLVPALVITFLLILVNGSFEISIIGTNGIKNYLDVMKFLTMDVVKSLLLFTHLLFFSETLFLRRISTKHQLLFKALSLPVLLAIACIVFLVFFLNFNVFPIKSYGRLLICGITIAVFRVFFLYIKNLNQLQIQEKEVEISHLKELKAKAELQSLHSRINPHFLYNSLNTIAGLANTDAQKTEQMALALSDLFRYTINRNGDQLTTIDEEVKMATTYLEVEKIRFDNRMNFKVSVEENLLLHPIPKFILQPLIENTIKHGVSQIKGNGEVSLTIRKADNEIIIEVKDNGPKFPEGLISGYGLQSIFDILKLTYGDSAGINWVNSPDKAITIKLPFQKQ